MEIGDWIVIGLIIIAIFWVKIYHPEIYNPIMGVVDSVAKTSMSLVGDAIAKVRSGTPTPGEVPLNETGGG